MKTKIKTKKSTASIVRTLTQVLFFILIFIISISKWLKELGIQIPFLGDASLHAVCPFGGVATIWEFASTGSFIQKIHSSSFILMILGVIVAILFGAIFCGYVCPFGTYQEWIGKLGRKLFKKKYNHFIPPKLDHLLRYLRYVILAMVLYNTAVTAKLVFQNIDPYYALFNFFTNEVALSAYVALGVFTVLSLFVERPWCKYFCPYGAFLGLFNLFRIFKIRRNKNTCIGCTQCDKVCPMNIRVSASDTISDHQCISCHLCTSEMACPVGNTVTISVKKGDVTVEN
ncbi:MAG: 4Fe-4S binding protein [Sphingobacteriia bacterium]|nr:4Fe-4S binding protein [Sphingobacteriia bacterium]